MPLRGRLPFVAGAILLAIYASTLAPDVTFWDAGELIAAAHSLGIPHPPGTPLFIFLLNVWARPFSFLGYAVATNLFSAVCTAAACSLLGAVVARALRRAVGGDAADWTGFGAALLIGTTSTVWSNATETEVYAASLLLSATMLVAGDRAGRDDGARSRVALAYLFGLAAALHTSALVAAPAAVVLCIVVPSKARDLQWSLVAAAALAMAIGTMSRPLGVIAGSLLVIALVIQPREAVKLSVAAVIGASPLIFLLIRATHDPTINQGNPSTIGAFADVVSRAQYEAVGLWPRRAPVWAQLANWFEYADWQFALSLGPTVVPTVPRVLMTLAFAALGCVGATAHRRYDRRSFDALALLFVCGTLGIIVYLNLRVSPSFGWGVLPDDIRREARERDYFFVLGFAVWAVWCAIGLLSLVRGASIQWRRRVIAAIAGVPLILNWRAVSRRAEPDASAPRVLGASLLESAPPNAILFVAGDNDTYPLWYLQEVETVRRDVRVVTIPLTGASWYGAELARRAPDLGLNPSRGSAPAAVFGSAVAAGRPVAASLAVEDADRKRLHGCWTVTGMVALLSRPTGGDANCSFASGLVVSELGDMAIDTGAVAAEAARLDRWRRSRPPKASIDGASEAFIDLLDCPRRMMVAVRAGRIPGSIASLDSTCNSK